MDITHPRLMYVKAFLFLCGGILAAAVILVDHPQWKTAAMLALAIWCFARAYYFAFYVMERYIDPSYRFAGLSALTRHLLRQRRR
jgi:hypothetical protein